MVSRLVLEFTWGVIFSAYDFTQTEALLIQSLIYVGPVTRLSMQLDIGSICPSFRSICGVYYPGYLNGDVDNALIGP
ncbi:unnamed protein product [Rodentolepis nana]|uniref:Secreted protein n=1 Tax=Rodentolepis nana TaxID=102285 RepID=A0A0R3TZF0_RODNA|nr:unnamed protein product [Rodentolepis nana]